MKILTMPGHPLNGAKVDEIRRNADEDGMVIVQVKLLEARNPYKEGELIDVFPYEVRNAFDLNDK